MAAILLSLLFIQSLSGNESITGTRLRITFGGPQAAIWKGEFRFPESSRPKDLRILGMQHEHGGKTWLRQNVLRMDLTDPTTYGGVELEIQADENTVVHYSIQTRLAGQPAQLTGEFRIRDLIDKNYSTFVEGTGLQLFVQRAPGDELKFRTGLRSLVLDENEAFRFSVALSRWLETVGDGGIEIGVSISKSGTGEKVWANQQIADRLQETIDFVCEEPLEAGVYELGIQAREPSRLPLTPPNILANRRIQFVVVGAKMELPISFDPADIELVYENVAGDLRKLPTSRSKPWDRINLGARKLFRYLPLPQNRQPKQHFEIGPNKVQYFRIPLADRQQPYRITVEYDAKNSQTDFVILDRANSTRNYTTLVNASSQNRQPEATGRSFRQSFVFWALSEEPVLLVRNLDSRSAIRVRRLAAYRINRSSDDYRLTTNRNRRLFTQFSAQQLFQELGAPKIPVADSYSLDDWTTYWTGGKRLIRLIRSAGYQGAVIDVNEQGSGIYPSELLQFTPALDTGIFFTDGRDPVRKDVLELLFRQFDANGLALIPRIEIPRYVARFEAADPEYQTDLRFRRADGSVSESYNCLNPHVEQLIREIILEVVTRYGHHRSFGGVAIRLGANQQLLVDGNRGFNEKLIKDFLAQQPVQNVSSSSAGQKLQWVLSRRRSEYLSWRAERVTGFLVELNQAVRSTCGRNLLVDYSELFTRNQLGRLRSDPDDRKALERYLPEHGLLLDSLTQNDISPIHPIICSGFANLADRKPEFASMAARSLLAENSSALAVMYRAEPRYEELAGETVGLDVASVRYAVRCLESNAVFRQRLTRQLASHDILLLFDQFDLGQRITDPSNQRIWKTFTSLPNVAFESVTQDHPDTPVVVRAKNVGSQSYLYVVNPSPWPCQVRIEFATSLINLRNVDGTFFSRLDKRTDGATLELSLQPYDLVAGVTDQTELKISNVQYSFPRSLQADLQRKKDHLLALIRFQKPTTSLIESYDPGFEKRENSEPLPENWARSPSDSFRLNRITNPKAAEGESAVEVRVEDDGRWHWIRSPVLVNNRTGRLSVLVSMKSIEGKPVPRVRLSIDGKSSGGEYYRFGTFSAAAETAEPARIENQWKVFAVHFDDVPTDLSQMRIGLDVMGKGAVVIDNVRVYDRWFDAVDREELTKLVSLAAHELSAGEFLKAHRLMESYWLEFIQQYNSVKPADTQPDSPTSNE